MASSSSSQERPNPLNWLHCNRCLVHANSGRNFIILSCHHVFCTGCLKDRRADGQSVCCICQAPKKAMPITKNMNPKIKALFSPSLQPTLAAHMQSAAFQVRQQMHDVKSLRRMEEELRRVEEKTSKFDETIAVAERKVEEKRRERRALQAEFAEMLDQLSPEEAEPHRHLLESPTKLREEREKAQAAMTQEKSQTQRASQPAPRASQLAPRANPQPPRANSQPPRASQLPPRASQLPPPQKTQQSQRKIVSSTPKSHTSSTGANNSTFLNCPESTIHSGDTDATRRSGKSFFSS